ncbi:hypothetical protein M513_00339 [Trichuris suis]|uniref:Transient receptor ion channel domain-containing protein n=1 Tax=Trichuris suis TaxID=68888 RepID=A0A085MN50_9BILA|nr:hypothetical protein M513_00339 [Trichuris suis]
MSTSSSTATPELIKRIFKLIDEDRLQELDGVFSENENLINVENDAMLTPLMYALLMKKSLVVRMLAGRTFYRFMDTILIAIVVDNTFAIDMMIRERPDNIDRETPIFFPHYMTPLMLAANYDNYGIVKLLINHEETLEIPHRPDCRCTKCQMLSDNGDCIERSENRLYAYRALCSHAFLLQNEIEDPILYAFLIARDLEKCQESDPDNAELYAKMSEHVQQLPLSLLNCCENSREVILMLLQKEGCHSATSATLARLQLAMDTKQKEFVANPRCFEVFKKLWMGNWDQKGYKRKETRTRKEKTILLLWHSLFYPISSLLYLVSNGALATSYEYPFARFLSNATSYVVFLICLVFFTQYKEGRTLRGTPDSKLKLFLLFYIWTYVFAMFTVTWIDLIRLGFRRFLCAWWRWYDFIHLIMYLLAFNGLLVSWTLTHVHGEPHAHRVHWDPLHPTLVYESLFTIAAILSSFRLFYFIQVLRSMGPLIVSIGNCIKDILTFLLLFFVVIGSFALGLNFLIEHYKYNVAVREGDVVEQPFFMTSIKDALRYLYWAWFGYLDPERLEVIVGNYDPQGYESKHIIVQYAAEFLSALYYIILVISLLNLMISIMATTAQSAIDNSKTEWQFVCCLLWSEYFGDCRALPPPMCLPYLLFQGIIWLAGKVFHNDNAEDKKGDISHRHYMQLLKTLKKRLILRHVCAQRAGMEPSQMFATGSYYAVMHNVVL